MLGTLVLGFTGVASGAAALVAAADYAAVAELVLDDELADARALLDTLIAANPELAELRGLRDMVPAAAPVPTPVPTQTATTATKPSAKPVVPMTAEEQAELASIQGLFTTAKTHGDYAAITRRLDDLSRRHQHNVDVIVLQIRAYTARGLRDYAMGRVWALQRQGLWEKPSPAVKAAQDELEKRGWIPPAAARKVVSNRPRVLTSRHLTAAVRAASLARIERRRTATATPEPALPLRVTGLDLMLVPVAEGSFSLSKAPEYSSRAVNIGEPFWLGETEVTQAQWQSLMRTNASDSKAPALPVTNITWDEALVFCVKLTERERAAGRLPEGYWFSLPTEAQWEYAARAGAAQESEAKIDAKAWHRGNRPGVREGVQTMPVAAKLPNAWGLYDMQGNVWEWCAEPFNKSKGPITATVPLKPTSTGVNYARGGGWFSEASMCRVVIAGAGLSSIHSISTPGMKTGTLGFRVVLNRRSVEP